MAHGRVAGGDLSAADVRFSATTVDHFQHPRNIGRLLDADAVGRVDDAETDTLIELYVKLEAGRIARATFRTFGCSACIAASSLATLLLIDRSAPLTSAEVDDALERLPADKRYCADLVAAASVRLFEAIDARRER